MYMDVHTDVSMSMKNGNEYVQIFIKVFLWYT